MQYRPILVGVHRYVGLTIALFLAVAGLTGSILAFQAELDMAINPRLFLAEQTGKPPLSIGQLVASVEADDPDARASWVRFEYPPHQTVSVFVRPRPGVAALDYEQVLIDPNTGTILGRRSWSELRLDRAHVIPFIIRLHYSLHIPGRAGIWLLGGVAVVWTMDCFIGFMLTLPRGRPFWQKWKTSWAIKPRAGPYRLNFDLHRAGGLWLWVVLFLLAISSISLNLNSEVFRPVLSVLLATAPTTSIQAPHATSRTTIDIDKAMRLAKQEARRREWNESPSALTISPIGKPYSVRFGRVEAGLGASILLVSAIDGSIIRANEAGSGPAGEVIADLMHPIHSGQIIGLPGRIVICIAGLAVTMLSITGVYIWWKKRGPRVARRRTRLRHSGHIIGEIHAAK